jgi:hypothetical protein
MLRASNQSMGQDDVSASLRGRVMGLLSVTGCGSTDHGTDNAIMVTPSTPTAMSVSVGGAQTYSVIFNPSDQHALRSLTVTGLNSLPSGWQGPASFTCATVTTGQRLRSESAIHPGGPRGGHTDPPFHIHG